VQPDKVLVHRPHVADRSAVPRAERDAQRKETGPVTDHSAAVRDASPPLLMGSDVVHTEGSLRRTALPDVQDGTASHATMVAAVADLAADNENTGPALVHRVPTPGDQLPAAQDLSDTVLHRRESRTSPSAAARFASSLIR
jgi:hypothetical protein